MNELDWWLIVGYVFVAAMFTWTFYLTVDHSMRRKTPDVPAGQVAVNGMVSASIGALWPVTLPICVVLATAAVMAGRKR